MGSLSYWFNVWMTVYIVGCLIILPVAVYRREPELGAFWVMFWFFGGPGVLLFLFG